MLISVKKRFVFIANPKTASTSIEAILTPYAEIVREGSPQRKHISWSETRKEYAFLFDNPRYTPADFFRFGVIRDPVEWVISWYNYRKYNDNIENPLDGDMTFEEFWDSNDWVKSSCQRKNFVDADDICRFNLVIPMEKLKQTLPILFGKLGVDNDIIPIKNKSKGGISRIDIPAKLNDEINKHYKDDLIFYHEWVGRHEGVFRTMQDSISLSSLSGTEKNVDETRRIVRKHKCPLVKEAEVHNVFVSGLGQGTLGGTVVLGAEVIKDDWQLSVVDYKGEMVVQWGLPSPIAAKRFPDAAQAKNARFLAVDVLFNSTSPIEFYLDNGRGDRHLIISLENEK